jgi:putative pyruvate formate lyase activating enzyme
MPQQSKRDDSIKRQLSACRLCANRCEIDRNDDNAIGACGAGPMAEVAFHGPHFGEESPISGVRGCGNVFFGHCSLSCVYCQNWQISQCKPQNMILNAGELADLFMNIEDLGVHTLGLVSPTSHIPTLAPAIEQAKSRGLGIPIVWNSSAYETIEALQIIDGLVDIYLPDLKYGSDSAATVYSAVTNYLETSHASLEEMLRQVGHLEVGDDGIARRGLLVRHLILPGDRADTTLVLQWLARTFGRDLQLSLLSQYKPTHQVAQGFFPEINRELSQAEYKFAVEFAEGLGLLNLFTQELDSVDTGNPDFNQANPFDWS